MKVTLWIVSQVFTSLMADTLAHMVIAMEETIMDMLIIILRRIMDILTEIMVILMETMNKNLRISFPISNQ